MSQYPIPQFIEEEGKIISFLTFRQFFLLVGGGALCLALYFLLPFYFFLPSAAVVVVLVLMIAFVKINHTSVVRIFLNFIGFAAQSKTYTWKKKESQYPFKSKVHYELKSLQEPAPSSSKTHLLKKFMEFKK